MKKHTMIVASTLLGLAMGANAQTPATMRATLPVARSAMRVDKLDNSKWDNTDGHDQREVDTQGEVHICAILVNFADEQFRISDNPKQTFHDMLNSPGFSMDGATGSVADYFRDCSNGQFKPVFDVYGPITLAHDEVYYVQTEDKYTDPATGRQVDVYPAGYMVKEACEALDGEIDFSKYDLNGDGTVDFIYLFHAGKGATTGGSTSTTIWPHAYTLTAALGQTTTHDGVEINRYATSCEIDNSFKLTGIGMFVHEFGHVLGLIDLYDTSHNGSVSPAWTPGTFDCMDAGNYNNNIHTPPLYSAYELYALEWLKPVEITGGADVVMLPLTAFHKTYKIPSVANPREYFLFESRAPHSWDKYLEGHGMAVWHIDYVKEVWDAGVVNNNPSHLYVDLIEADETYNANTRNGDLFPGASSIAEYSPSQSPRFISWDNKSTGYDISRIVMHEDGCVSLRIDAENGSEMAEAAIGAPRHFKAVAASENSITVNWDAADNASGYRLSVWDANAVSEETGMVEEFVDGWYFTDLGNATSATIEGLKRNARYALVLYPYNDANTSRCEAPLYVSTAADMASTLPELDAIAVNCGAMFHWTDVPEADSYQLTIATRNLKASDRKDVCSFEGNKLPEGWSGNGSYESGDKYIGAAEPAYAFKANGQMLATPLYDDEIHSISFYARQRDRSGEAVLDIYGEDAQGRISYIGRETGFSGGGDTRTVVVPEGYNRLRLVYTMFTSSLEFYIDDVQVNMLAPVDYNVVQEKSLATTSYLAGDLENGTEYAAFVCGVKDGAKSAKSHVALFTPSADASAVDEIGTDLGNVVSLQQGCLVPANPEMTYNVYDAEGRAVALGIKGSFELPARGAYIVVSGTCSTKFMF